MVGVYLELDYCYRGSHRNSFNEDSLIINMADQTPAPEPEPPSDPAPSDPVSRGIDNASSIFDLGSKVIYKATAAWQQGSANREKRHEAESMQQELKDGLGEWETGAKDEKGR